MLRMLPMGPKPKHEDVIADLEATEFEELGLVFDVNNAADAASDDFSALLSADDVPEFEDMDPNDEKKEELASKVLPLPEYMDD